MEVILIACLALLFELKAEINKENGEQFQYLLCRAMAFLMWLGIIVVGFLSIMQGINNQ